MFEADASGRLLVTLADLGEIAAALAPEEAAEALDAMVAEVFFRDWPAIREWAESLWEYLEVDLAAEALPESDPWSPETGVVD